MSEDRMTELMERTNRIISALEPQIIAAIKSENTRFDQIETRLAALEEWQRARSDPLKRSIDYLRRDVG